jgi:integrase
MFPSLPLHLDPVPMQRLMILLAAYARLRGSEIARVHMRDMSGGELLVKGERGHQRRIPLHPDLMSEIAAERSRRRERGHGSGWHGDCNLVDGWLFASNGRDEPMSASNVGKVRGLDGGHCCVDDRGLARNWCGDFCCLGLGVCLAFGSRVR